jgi:lipopolysaccharide/colanic/teichoic acid biosynthesis glycosyltransferase
MNQSVPNIAGVAQATLYEPGYPRKRGLLQPLSRVRYQILGAIVLAVLLPALWKMGADFRLAPGSGEYTLIGSAVAMLAGAYIMRRIVTYPGVQAHSFVLPTFFATYSLVAFTFFFLRIDYSRFQILASFSVCIPWFFITTIVEKRYKRPALALLPFGEIGSLMKIDLADWTLLRDPKHVPTEIGGIVADLRSDFPPEWERLLATASLKGTPVYHSKYVVESLTGRVQIEHLSENSLGSLLPSSLYLRCKRGLDLLFVLLTLPIVLPLAAVAAVLIKLEDGGPILFTQPRMGFRGNVFAIRKFRTMRWDEQEGSPFTEGEDARITRIGRLLRRYRVDELPQIVNILRGEMSWIGPRPESLPLSTWYEEQIPFYSYRHIVRPGITGWAQVQQGYAAQIDAVTGKLHYDFFYIKHFSPWLDLLIIARTIRTVVTGFGAR